MKRNDVVYSRRDEISGLVLYGRITRMLPNGLIETMDCGKYVRVQPAEDLVCVQYKGFTDPSNGRFRPMPTLRRLKQLCSHYDKTVWKRNRTGLFCDSTSFLTNLPSN